MKKIIFILMLMLLVAACNEPAQTTEPLPPAQDLPLNTGPEPAAEEPVIEPEDTYEAPQLEIGDLTCAQILSKSTMQESFDVVLDEKQRKSDDKLTCTYKDLYTNTEVLYVTLTRNLQPEISENAKEVQKAFATQYFIDELNTKGPLIKYIDADTGIVVEVQFNDANAHYRVTAKEKVEYYGTMKKAKIMEAFFKHDMENLGVTDEMSWEDVPPKPRYADSYNLEVIAKLIGATLA